MEIIKPRTLSGFMELLPEKQLKFDRMAEVLRKTYASYGFAPLDTPVIEDAQILLAKGGGETEKQIYRFTKGDSDLALRFDLTVPLAKYVALHYNELAFPFRRFQISKVYRGERAQRGRFREFYQADIDIIGDGKLDILNEAAKVRHSSRQARRDMGRTELICTPEILPLRRNISPNQPRGKHTPFPSFRGCSRRRGATELRFSAEYCLWGRGLMQEYSIYLPEYAFSPPEYGFF